jgi:hypothetical protein
MLGQYHWSVIPGVKGTEAQQNVKEQSRTYPFLAVLRRRIHHLRAPRGKQKRLPLRNICRVWRGR